MNRLDLDLKNVVKIEYGNKNLNFFGNWYYRILLRWDKNYF